MTLAFNDVPHIYTRVRPEYPPTFYDTLFEMLPDRGAPVRAVEVGAGTGQATGPLLARGAHVTAVEIGPIIAAVQVPIVRRHLQDAIDKGARAAVGGKVLEQGGGG